MLSARMPERFAGNGLRSPRAPENPVCASNHIVYARGRPGTPGVPSIPGNRGSAQVKAVPTNVQDFLTNLWHNLKMD